MCQYKTYIFECMAKPFFLLYQSSAKFVDHHRPELIKKVSKVLAISEELRDMVHDETYSLIKAKEICQDKMRVLYGETLRSGGDRVKAAFYDALKKHEPNLMQELGKSLLTV